MGSSDIFTGDSTRSVNFLAAHDGFTLADVVSYAAKHNGQNGEQNRDGHDENFSWNNGAEGASDDPAIAERRKADVKALLATLFASRGTMMLTAGDEFGRTQQGNNNAYAQDNDITWLDWPARDLELEDFVAALAAARAKYLSGEATHFVGEAVWRDLEGHAMTPERWNCASLDGFEVRVALENGAIMRIRLDRDARQCLVDFFT
jgi:glycogen operon protein